ncbi:MAG: hypothetical protein ABI700_31975, partial [Chloroflexota bacterium]
MSQSFELSDDAKQAAKHLLEDWNSGIVDRQFDLIDMTAGNDNRSYLVPSLGVRDRNKFREPEAADLEELNEAGLIKLIYSASSTGSRKYSVVLTKRLKDYFTQTTPNGTTTSANLEQTISGNVFISYRRLPSAM